MILDIIYTMDNVRGLRELVPDDSIDLTVTSPPYDNLRTYNGFSFDFEVLAHELYRVTKPGGVVVWVVGDATIKGSETGTSFRQALYFKDAVGFNLHDTMIYKKVGCGATGSNKAYLQSFEYMFVFSKGAPKTVNLLYDRKNKHWNTTGKYSTKTTRKKANGEIKDERRKPSKEYGRRFNIWEYNHAEIRWNAVRYGFRHPAPFPESLAKDHILSWSNPGDVVLDPFMGSGTTAKMALLNDRHYIGFEISDEYVAIAEERLRQAKTQRGGGR
ncbi:site-specific DNA-methyltransferase [Thermoactinomyces daqus]|uniref:Methyltransferase n=1 Tax=Thermoactinomyces daqus TaxID=1329516 RepID=A0A7W2AGV7_9BACL|nr:site-specific DNA-methyltransferase [Thermoactinomyces daqus]MBA4542026.1 site-specific DNA-methyltransferase [Thermoactinomyces daqus]